MPLKQDRTASTSSHRQYYPVLESHRLKCRLLNAAHIIRGNDKSSRNSCRKFSRGNSYRRNVYKRHKEDAPCGLCCITKDFPPRRSARKVLQAWWRSLKTSVKTFSQECSCRKVQGELLLCVCYTCPSCKKFLKKSPTGISRICCLS